MRMKKWFKSTVAVLAALSMLLENGYSVYATETGDYAENVVSDEIEVEDTTSESSDDISIEVVSDEEAPKADISSEADDSSDMVLEETASEELSDEGITDGVSDVDEMVISDGAEVLDETSLVDESIQAAQEEILDITQDSEVVKSLNVNGNEVSGEGYSDIEVRINASSLPNLAYYGMRVYTDAEVYYQGEKVKDNYIPNLSSFTDRVYLANLDNKPFTFTLVGESVAWVNADYSIASVDAGTVDVVVSLGDENAITEQTEYSLTTGAGTLSGSGYDAIEISCNYNDKNTDKDNNDNSFSYNLYIDTDSEAVTVNGSIMEDGGVLLDDKVDSIVIEGLDKKDFAVRVKANQDELIEEPAVITFDVTSEAEGKAALNFEYTTKVAAKKRVYEYEDEKVYVKAVLEKVDAIPDDAYFCVTPITDIDDTLELLNNNSDDPEVEYTEENTVVYDVTFYTDETKSEKIEPEEGSVSVSISFKNNELEDGINAENSESVEVNHITDEGVVEEVNADVSVEGEQVEFDIDSLSYITLTSKTTVQPGTTRSYRDILGDAVYYGMTANRIKIDSHCDSNFATGTLQANCNTTQGVYTGAHVPGEDIIGAYDTSSGANWYADSSGNTPYVIHTTPEVASILKNNNNVTSRPISIDSNHTKAELQSRVSAMVSGTLSETLAKEPNAFSFSSIASHVDRNNNNTPYLIDITSKGEGTYYINFDTVKYSDVISHGGPMVIRMNKNQSIVFNIPDTDVTLNKFTLVYDGKEYDSAKNDSSVDEPCKHLVWNLVNATTAMNQGGIFGMVLAPQADFKIGTTSTGWLVCNKITGNNGEWHMVWQDLPGYKPATAEFGVKKTFENAPSTWPEFTFKVEAVTSGAPMPANTTLKVKNSDYASFGTITYEKGNGAGTKSYIYKVSEVKGSDSNVTYDSTVYYVKVDVKTSTDVNANVTVTATTSYSTGQSGPWTTYNDNSSLNFTNTYVNQGSLLITKVVKGTDINKTYYVTVKGSDGKYYDKDGKTYSSAKPIAITNNETIEVKKLNKKYAYTVTETDSTGKAVSANTSSFPYSVTGSGVTVSLNNGQSNPSVTITNTSFVPSEVQFNATKTVDDGVPGDGEVFTFNLEKWDGSKWVAVESKKNATGVEVNNINFSKISYALSDNGKTYYYRITESGENVKTGYSYDTNSYIVKVDVTVGSDNKQVVTKTYYDADTIASLGQKIDEENVVFYDYKNKPTTVQFNATKTVDNGVPGDGETFDFTLKEYNASTKKWSEVETVKNKTGVAANNINFSEITYNSTDVGTHYYMISETGSNANYTYDKNNYIVKVDVSADSKMNVSTKVTYYDADDLSKLGSTIKESDVKFNDDVIVKPGEVTFEATKSVDDGIPETGEKFDFTLEKWDGSKWVKVETMQNDAAKVTFTTITYDKEDGLNEGTTEYYRITESGVSTNTPDYSQYSYDKTNYIVKVNVVNNGFEQDITTTYYKSESEIKSVSGTIGEEIKPSDVIFYDYKFKPDSVSFKAKKTVDGGVVGENEKFTFNLEKWDEQTKSFKEVKSVTNDKGLVDFGSFELTMDDNGKTLYYRISESGVNTSTYYTYDANKYIVAIPVSLDENTMVQKAGEYAYYETTVADNTNPATVIKSAETVSADEVIFDNEINVQPNSVQFIAHKTVDDMTPGEGEVFNFKIEQVGGDYSESVDNDTTGNVTFKPIEYTKADAGKTYVYKITENGTMSNQATVNPEYYTYDKTEYYAVVEVKQNGDKLDITTTIHVGSKNGEVVGENAIDFHNYNKLTPGELNLKASKTVDDKVPGKDEVFEFQLDKWNKETSSWEMVECANNNSGSIVFSKIKYDKEDEGVIDFYRISETGSVKTPDNTTYTYDQNKFIVKVEVKVNDDFVVVPEKTDFYIGKDTSVIKNNTVTDKVETLSSESALVFKNIKNVTPTEIELKAKKTVDDGVPGDGEYFTFTLEEWDGSSWKVVDTKENTTGSDAENVLFNKITFTKEDGENGGTIRYYRILESGESTRNPEAGKYTYDTTNYIAKVEVVNNGSTQEAKVTYYKSVSEVTGINNIGQQIDDSEVVFKDYKYSPAEIVIDARKTVDDETPGEGEVFTFILEKQDENGNWVKVDEATNTEGYIEFDKITYDQGDDGTHVYRVTEKGKNNDTNQQYTVDGSKYVVTVVVSTDEKNVQTAEVTVTKTNEDGVVSPANGDVSDKDSTPILFEDYKNRGLLTVKKLVYVNDELDSACDEVFKFKVKRDSTNEYVKNPDDGSYIFTVKANEEVTVADLWNDTYTVEEVENDPLYKISYEGNGVAVNLKSSPVVTIKNSKYVGSIEVSKLDSKNAKSFDDSTKLAAKFALLKSDGTTPVYFKGSNYSYTYATAEEAAASSGISNVFDTPKDGSVVINNLPEGSYILKEIETPEGYVALSASVAFSVTKSGITCQDTNAVIKKGGTFYLAMGIKNDRKSYSLKLNKLEANENDQATTVPVKDAYFTLVGKNNGVVVYNNTFKVSSEDGVVTFKDLPWGEYELTESTVPNGYVEVTVGGDAPKSFVIGEGTVDANGASTIAGLTNISAKDAKDITLEGNVYNKKQYGNLLLKKVGKNGMTGDVKALDNVTFKLIDSNGNDVPLKKVDEKQSIDGITVSSYYLYTTDTSDSKVTSLVTADGGYIYVEGLPVVPSNNYAFVEQSPYATKFGYVAPSNPSVGMTVVANETKSTTVENNTIEIGVDFVKVDSKKTSKTLSGTTFELFYETEGSYKTTGKTSTSIANGIVSFSGLSAGKYYAKEIETPGSYIATGDVVYFEIPMDYSDDTEIKLYRATLTDSSLMVGEELKKNDSKYIFGNDQGTGEASLKKLKETSDGTFDYEGVAFKLMKDSDSFVDAIFGNGMTEASVSKKDGAYVYDESSKDTLMYTDAQGNIKISELPWGEYYFVEVETDGVTDDYTVLSEEYCASNLKFTIDENHSSYDFNGDKAVVNKIKKANVELKKLDKTTGKVIDYTEDGFNFVFDLIKVDGANEEVVRSSLATAAGVIDAKTIGDLDYGTYYFLEKSVGEGYKLLSADDCKAQLSFTLNDDTTKNGKETITVECTNERDRNGKVTIEKTGIFGDTVPTSDTVDVTFALYSKTNNNKSFTAKVAALLSKLFSKEGYYPYGEYTFMLTRTNVNNVYTGTFTIDELPWDDYYLVEVEAPDGLVISKEQKAFTIGAGKNHLEYSFKVENSPAEGGAQIAKYDFETNKLIEDYTATFDVYKAGESTPIRTGITTVAGIAKVSNLQSGDYYFVETSAPNGYILDDSIHYNFTVTDDPKADIIVKADKTVEGKDENGNDVKRIKDGVAYNKEIPCKVTISKYLNKIVTGNEFDGVAFKVERKSGLFSWKEEASGITDNGTVTFDNLPWGTYRIVEVVPDGMNAPEGYELDSKNNTATSPTFVLGNSAEREDKFSYGETLVNIPKGAKVTLKKVNEKNNALADAKFTLYREDGSVVDDTIVSTEDKWVSPVLEQGKYYFVENKAPDDYSIIEPGNYSVEPTASFVKPESAQDEFKVEAYTYDNKNVEYRFWFAIAAADLNASKDGDVLEELGLVVKNERKTGAFGFKKVDVNTYREDTSKGLSGASFYLKNSEGKAVNVKATKDGYEYDSSENATSTTIVTGENGIAHVSNLPTGEYTLVEFETPINPATNSRYVLPAKAEWNVVITDNGDDDSLIINPIKNGDSFTSFTFTKKDVDGDLVGDAVFRLFKKDEIGNYVYENVKAQSDAVTGAVTFDNLYAGDYYVVELKKDQKNDYAYVADEKPYYFKVAFDDDDNPMDINLFEDAEYKSMVEGNTVVNTPKEASVTIKKVSLTNTSNFLTGATFELIKDDATSGTEKVIENAGEGITFNNLEVGHTYKIVETNAPEGYRLPSQIASINEREAIINQLIAFSSVTQNISVVAEDSDNDNAKDRIAYVFNVTKANVNESIEITAPNAPVNGSISVQKSDKNDVNIKLEGAKFALYSDGKIVANEKVTDENGNCEFTDLAWGTYDVVETNAPEGYPQNSKLYAEYKDADGNVVGVKVATAKIGIESANGEKLVWLFTGEDSIRNELVGEIDLIKKDRTDELAMSQVKFVLHKENDASFQREYTTNSQGRVVADNLAFGKYYFDEIVPEGYEYDKEYTAKMNAQLGDTNHYIRYPNGNGFIEITEQKPVSSEAENAIYNERGKGKVKAEKVNQYGEVIKNNPATFDLYCTTSGTGWQLAKAKFSGQEGYKLGEVKTNNDGILLIGYSEEEGGVYFTEGLPFGNYFLIETEAPKGYKPVSDDNEIKIDFTISKENPTEEKSIGTDGTIVNEEEGIKINLKKVSNVDGKLNVLKGSKFALYDADTNTLLEEKELNGNDADAVFTGDAVNGVMLRADHRYYLVETKAPTGYKHGGNVSAPSEMRFENPVYADGNETGKYAPVKEETADGKYIYRYYFTPTKDAAGKTIAVTCENEEGYAEVIINKYFDGDTPDDASGIVFVLTDEAGKEFQATTKMETLLDDKGKALMVDDKPVKQCVARWNDIRFGKYTLSEIYIPENVPYTVSSNTQTIIVDEEHAKIEADSFKITGQFVNSANNMIKGRAAIIKTVDIANPIDNKLKPVNGMVFNVKRVLSNGTEVIASNVTTNASGLAEIPLEAPLNKGNYFFEEAEGEAERFGFEPSNVKYYFSINDANGTSTGENFVDVGRSFKVNEDGSWTILDTVSDAEARFKAKTVDKAYVVENTSEKGRVILYKFDSAVTPKNLKEEEIEKHANETLKGAKFALYKDGKLLLEDIESEDGIIKVGYSETDGGKYLTEGLEWGDYYFVETVAPAYHKAEKDEATGKAYKYEFTIGPDNNNAVISAINGTYSVDVKVAAFNAPYIKISKKDLETKTELAGATLSLSRKNDANNENAGYTQIVSWQSGEEKEFVIGDGADMLKCGVNYRLEEKEAPKGYSIAKAIDFTISEDGKLIIDGDVVTDNTVTMYNAKNISIDKFISGTKNAIVGAKLVITDMQGNEIESFTTDGESHQVAANLKVGATYVLKEEIVPSGYLKADDILFSVNDDGSVKLVGENADKKNISEDGKNIYMFDRPFEVVINKVRGNGTKDDVNTFFVKGAKLIIWDVEGKSVVTNDQSGNIITTQGKPILLKTASRSAYAAANVVQWEGKYQVIYNVAIEQGKSYYVLEMSAPSGYLTKQRDNLEYGVVGEFALVKREDGSGLYECYARNDDFKLVVSKEYNGTVLDGAILQITDDSRNPVEGLESLEIKDGKKVLITALSKEEYEKAYGTEDEKNYNIVYGVALSENDNYYLTEIKAPDGYASYTQKTPIYQKEGKDVYGKKININGETTIVSLEDTPLEIALSKVVTNTNKDQYLGGAHMQLIDKTLNKVVWPEDPKGYVTERQPILFTTRKLTEAESKSYAEIIGDDEGEPRLIEGHDYIWRELEGIQGYLSADDYYGVGMGREYIEETFTLTKDDVRKTSGSQVREIKLYNKRGGTLEIKGNKDWGEIPMSDRYSYEIVLLRNHVGEDASTATVVKSITMQPNEYTFKFEGLEKYDYNTENDSDDNAKEYAYYITEKIPEDKKGDFEWKASKDLIVLKDGTKLLPVSFEVLKTVAEYTIYNRSNEKVSIPVTKKWVLYRDNTGKVDMSKTYKDVTINLLQNGVVIDSFVVKNGGVDGEEPGEVKHEFKDLPKYDENGKIYNYTVSEEGVDASICESSISSYVAYFFMITNRPLEDPFRIRGEKVWNDPEGSVRDDIDILLYRDNKLFKRTHLVNNKFDFGPMYEFNLGYGATDPRVLDATDNKQTADGHKYKFELKEVSSVTGEPISNYEIKVDFNGEIRVLDGSELVKDVTTSDGEILPEGTPVSFATITNTIEQEYIKISGNKTWEDAGISGVRPTVTFKLYATDTVRNHELVDTYVMNNNRTYYEFTNLPKYDENYQIINYTVEEEGLKGYETKRIETEDGFDFVNIPTKVRISKVDSKTGEELPGAEFEITEYATGEKVASFVTTKTPFYIEGLAIGEKYVVTETKAPYGYELASPVVFTADKAGVELTVTVKDEPIYGSVLLMKRDEETRDMLEGAVFNLFKEDGSLVNALGSAGTYEYYEGAGALNLEVSRTGTLVVNNLPYGTYYFKEAKAPQGYDIDTEPKYFSVTNQKEVVNISVLDPKRLGTVTLTKVNEAGTATLEGATFELYSKIPQTAGQAVASTIYKNVYYLYGTYTTDESGTITVEDLPWDDYYFIETEAPEGYELNLDTNGDPLVYTFSINDKTSKSMVVDMGSISNSPEVIVTPTPTPTITPTPTPYVEEPTPTPEHPTGVKGVRKLKGNGIQGVLGVRSAPTKGVLGERVGPATGDTSNIILWSLLLAASLAVVIALIVQSKKKKKTE